MWCAVVKLEPKKQSRTSFLFLSWIISSVGIKREYWMIYRGQGFLAVRWFCSFQPLPPPLQSANYLSSQSSCVSPVEITDGRVGGGAKSCDDEKAWSSINHLILLVRTYTRKTSVLFNKNDDLKKSIIVYVPFCQNPSKIGRTYSIHSQIQKKHLLYSFWSYCGGLAEVKNISKRQDITLLFH